MNNLEKAHRIIIQELNNKIIADQLLINHNQRKYVFRDGSILYIVYNNAGEYAYQLLFSNQHLDRVRFDSKDKNWKVNSQPHHFHPRNSETGYTSPMVGDPEKDSKILVELIKNGKLKDKNLKF